MGQRRAFWRELGAELQKRRLAAGLTTAGMAEHVGWSTSLISRVETGQRLLDRMDLAQYLGWCGIFMRDGRDVYELADEAEAARGFWLNQQDDRIADSLRSLIYHETAANNSTIYEPNLVHWLLQTRAYARAMIGAERWRTQADVDRCVRLRMDRQRILDRPPGLASFTFFLHEQALRSEVGGAAVMQEQLLKIVLTSALRNVTVRVVQASKRESFAFGGAFRVLERDQCEPLVFLDNHATGLFLEEPEYVEPYATLVSAIADVALDAGESRECAP
jgi:transcriptional regulator with XRE-family HTH domain